MKKAGLVNGRAVAVDVLERVEKDAAFAKAALEHALCQAERLARQDKALATEIVYGTLRHQIPIDAELASYLRQPLHTTNPYLRAALRAALYQLRFLDRVPAYAVVSETVTLVRKKRGAVLAKVANAVLRRLSREKKEDPSKFEIQQLNLPPWLQTLFEQSLGSERAACLSQASVKPCATLWLPYPERQEELRRMLQQDSPSAEITPSRWLSDALHVSQGGALHQSTAYREGHFNIQEEGAQIASVLCGVKKGEYVLDACAGRGNKSLRFAQSVGDSGHVTAVDIHPRKLAVIAKQMTRLGIDTSRVSTAAVDLSIGLGALPQGQFDRVIVDAPCSGLGTLYRHPERIQQTNLQSLAKLAELQYQILCRVLPLVRPGGYLVYIVCTPARDEGIQVVEKVQRTHAHIRPDPPRLESPAGVISADSDGMLRLGPWLSGDANIMDAFQLFRWIVR